MGIKLRAHHLICLHFFKGEGYSEEFILNLKNIVSHLEASEDIKIVDGMDDVCFPCPNNKGGLCFYKPGAEEEVRALDNLASRLLDLKAGEETSWPRIKSKLSHVLPEWKNLACEECNWKGTCFKSQKNSHGNSATGLLHV